MGPRPLERSRPQSRHWHVGPAVRPWPASPSVSECPSSVRVDWTALKGSAVGGPSREALGGLWVCQAAQEGGNYRDTWFICVGPQFPQPRTDEYSAVSNDFLIFSPHYPPGGRCCHHHLTPVEWVPWFSNWVPRNLSGGWGWRRARRR